MTQTLHLYEEEEKGEVWHDKKGYETKHDISSCQLHHLVDTFTVARTKYVGLGGERKWCDPGELMAVSVDNIDLYGPNGQV